MNSRSNDIYLIVAACLFGPFSLFVACRWTGVYLSAADAIGNSVLWVTAVIVTYYTYETHRLRTGAERREVVELRGYNGLDNESMTIQPDEIGLRFKNFGKTPLFRMKRVHKFIRRDDGREYPMGHSYTETTIENPGAVSLYRLTLTEADVPRQAGLHNFDLILESSFSTYTGQKFKHILRLRIHHEDGRTNPACYVVSEEELPDNSSTA